MKKILATLLIFTLIFLPAPVLATDERVNVETLTFDKIEQHMNTYNAQIDANNDVISDIEVPDNDVKTNIKNMIDGIDAQIATYIANKSELQKMIDEGTTDLNTKYLRDVYNSLIATSASNRANLQAQYDSFDENRNKASDAKSKAALQTEAGNKMLIWGAEQLYLSYNSLEHQIRQQRSQLYLLLKQQNAMKLRQELGLVTNSNYKSFEAGVKDLNFAVDTMTEQQKSIKEQLNVMLNQNHDTVLVIEATPELDDDLLEEMDFDEDSKYGEWKSYNVRLKDDSWERDAEERKFKLDFKKSYENVLDKQESVELGEFKLENQKELFKFSELRYKLGMISKISFDEQQMTYDNEKLKLQIAKEELFKAYRQYEWMKKGLTL